MQLQQIFFGWFLYDKIKGNKNIYMENRVYNFSIPLHMHDTLRAIAVQKTKLFEFN